MGLGREGTHPVVVGELCAHGVAISGHDASSPEANLGTARASCSAGSRAVQR